MTPILEGSLHRKCGGRYEAATTTVSLRVSGMPATVEAGVLRCSACGDEHRTVEQREAAEQAAIAHVRARHGLMTAREIRQFRDRLGLTTEQMGDLLYGVPRSVVEGWERGRYVQNPEVDVMLRSFADRDVLVARAARAGIALPAPPVLEAVADIPVVAAADLPPAPERSPGTHADVRPVVPGPGPG